MTEWQVVLVIISLAGFAATLITPIIKLTHSITKLTANVETLTIRMTELSETNRDAHSKLWDKTS